MFCALNIGPCCCILLHASTWAYYLCRPRIIVRIHIVLGCIGIARQGLYTCIMQPHYLQSALAQSARSKIWKLLLSSPCADMWTSAVEICLIWFLESSQFDCVVSCGLKHCALSGLVCNGTFRWCVSDLRELCAQTLLGEALGRVASAARSSCFAAPTQEA